MTEGATAPRRLARPGALLLGWSWLALVNGIVIASTGVAAKATLRVRLLHHLYDAGQLLAAGLCLAAIAGAWRRWGPARARAWAHGAVFVLAATLSALLIADDLVGFAGSAISEDRAERGAVGLAAIAGLLIPLAHVLGRLLGRPRTRLLAVAAAGAVAAANGVVLERLYPGLHLLTAWCAAMLTAGALEGLAVPSALCTASQPRRALSLVGHAVVCVWGAAALVLRPSGSVADQLFSLPSTVFAPFIAEAQSSFGSSEGAPGEGAPILASQWYVDRRGVPDVLPSGESQLPPDGIVVLFIVDCLRSDLIADDEHAQDLPALHRMREESVYFANARAPGSATAQSVAAIFSGRHYSALHWELRPGAGKVLPHEDEAARFPELLTKAGVRTVNFAGLSILVNDFAIVRGFAEEYRAETKEAQAKWLVDGVLERMNEADGERLFVYAHFMEAHAPYEAKGSKGTPFERYLAEVQIIDREIGRFLQVVGDSPLAARTAIFVTADHGEAFGEHNTSHHSTTVYEELIRVPLLVKAPGAAPRTVDAPVSLVDVGPTTLDLFGRPTPGSFLGESLLPFLNGRDAALSRPIVTESGYLQRAMVFADGTKMIHDARRDSVELYDLKSDPGELSNLYEESSERSAERLAKLRAFFETHAFAKPSSKTPIRR